LAAFITGSGELTIAVPTLPVVNPPVLSGGNLVLSGTGGQAGAGYTVLSTTNVALPLADWTTNSTGTFDGSGNFSNGVPVNVSQPTEFLLIRVP